MVPGQRPPRGQHFWSRSEHRAPHRTPASSARTPAQHALTAGAVLGLACSFKVWPVPLIVVILAWTAIQRGWTRVVADRSAGAAASLTGRPGAVRALGSDRLLPADDRRAGRGGNAKSSLLVRLALLRDGLHGVSQHQRFVPTVLVLALALTVAVVAVLVSRRGAEPALWGLFFCSWPSDRRNCFAQLPKASTTTTQPSSVCHSPQFSALRSRPAARKYSVPRGWLLGAARSGQAAVLPFPAAGGIRPTAVSADEPDAALPPAECVWATSRPALLVARPVRRADPLQVRAPISTGTLLVKGQERAVLPLMALELRRADSALLIGVLLTISFGRRRCGERSRIGFEQVGGALPERHHGVGRRIGTGARKLRTAAFSPRVA